MDPLAERRLEEKERRRNDILDAAEAVAAEAGFEALTMEQVAREARLSRALLYVYFQDRVDLHMGICQRALADLHARFAACATAGERGLDRVVAMGRAYVAFASEQPIQFEALARFEASDTSAPDPESNLQACLAAGGQVHGLMTAALAEGMADGSISREAGEPNAVSMALWGMTHGVIQIARMKRAVLAQHQVSPADLIEQGIRMATLSLRRD